MDSEQLPQGEEYDNLARIYPDTMFLYNPDANPSGASFPGVPLRHLRAGDVETIPEHIMKSIAASGWYTLVPTIPPVEE